MSLRMRTFSKQYFGPIISLLLGLALNSVVAAQANPEEISIPFPQRDVHLFERTK